MRDWNRRRWLGAAAGVTGLASVQDMALAFDEKAAGTTRAGTPKGSRPRSKMKISGFRATKVASPDHALLNSWDVHGTHFIRTILEIETSDGFKGVSEVKGESVDAVNAAKEYALGRDPFEIERFRKTIPDLISYSAVETACLDLIGKVINRRVADLIGGAYREEAAYSAYLFFVMPTPDKPAYTTPEDIARQFNEFNKKHGFKSVKFKAGILPPEREVEALRLMRAQWPNAPLRIDPNAAWSIETSLRVAKLIEPIGMEYYEDPTPGFDGMAAVRRQTKIPLATNMIVTAQEHVAEAFRKGSIDVLLLDNHYMGGLNNCRQMAATCEALGWKCSGHSSNHLGISMAAMTHMNCALAHSTYDADSHYPWTSDDVIKGGKLQFRDGKMALPDAPGLGVEIDPDRFAMLRENVAKARPLHDELLKWNPKHPQGKKGIRW